MCDPGESPIESQMQIIENPVARLLVFTLGIFSVGLGLVGAFLPLLPTTPFIMLAAWCFMRSSAKAHAWIYRQPLFGKALTDWEKNRSISRTTKVTAIGTILFSLVFIWIKVNNLWIKVAVSVFLVSVSIFIATRGESPGEEFSQNKEEAD